MTLDERIEALTRNGERLSVNISALRSSVGGIPAGDGELKSGMAEMRASMSAHYASIVKDGENIRALARVAEIHKRRLSDIEGTSDIQ